MSNSKDKEMTIFEHLDELRNRIIIAVLGLVVGSIVGYFLNPYVLKHIIKFTGENKLYYLGPADAFFIRIKISIVLGIFLSSPVTFWQVWSFVTPALKHEEKKYVIPTIFFSVFLFLAGGIFGILALPLSLKVLISFGGENLLPLFTADRYISFVVLLVLSFGIVFELPLVVLLLVKLGVLSPVFLKSNRKYALLFIVAIAAVITPSTDIFTLLMMAGPLYLLFELSIFLTRFVKPKI